MNYPNMSPEVLESIEEYFKGEPEVLVDCLLYLKNLWNDGIQLSKLSTEAETRLRDMNRCPNCGSMLETYHYQESHDELDGCPMEDMYEPYCPECDCPHQMKLRGV